MKLFKDEALTEPLETVDLGETWFLEAKTRKAWLFNDTKAFLTDIRVDVGKEASVKVEAPRTLKSGDKAPITFTWNPEGFEDLNLTITVHAFEVDPNGQFMWFQDEALTQPTEYIEFYDASVIEKKHSLTIWLLNNRPVLVRDIKVDMGSERRLKVDAPRTLKSYESAPVTFTWGAQSLEGLKCEFTVRAVEVYAP